MPRRVCFTDASSLSASLRSLSGGEERYQVAYDEKTCRCTCNCPAFRFGRGKPCKHIERFAKAFIRKERRAARVAA